jgi:hypothetical protein
MGVGGVGRIEALARWRPLMSGPQSDPPLLPGIPLRPHLAQRLHGGHGPQPAPGGEGSYFQQSCHAPRGTKSHENGHVLPQTRR